MNWDLISQRIIKKDHSYCAVIISYNKVPKISEIVRAINNNIIDGLIVVDNSTDINVPDCLRQSHSKADLNKVIFIRNGVNLGISKAMNLAFSTGKKYGFEYYFLLDDDAFLHKDYFKLEIETFSRILISDKNVGVVCPIVTNGENYFGMPFSHLEDVSEIKGAITSGSLVSLDAIEAANGYNVEFFLEHADIDFFRRIREKGFKIFRINTALILQDFGTSLPAKGITGLFLKIFNYIYYYSFVKLNLINDFVYEISIYPPNREHTIIRSSKKVMNMYHFSKFRKFIVISRFTIFLYLKFMLTKNPEYLNIIKGEINAT